MSENKSLEKVEQHRLTKISILTNIGGIIQHMRPKHGKIKVIIIFDISKAQRSPI